MSTGRHFFGDRLCLEADGLKLWQPGQQGRVGIAHAGARLGDVVLLLQQPVLAVEQLDNVTVGAVFGFQLSGPNLRHQRLRISRRSAAFGFTPAGMRSPAPGRRRERRRPSSRAVRSVSVCFMV